MGEEPKKTFSKEDVYHCQQAHEKRSPSITKYIREMQINFTIT